MMQNYDERRIFDELYGVDSRMTRNPSDWLGIAGKAQTPDSRTI